MNRAVAKIDTHPSSWPSPLEGEEELSGTAMLGHTCATDAHWLEDMDLISLKETHHARQTALSSS